METLGEHKFLPTTPYVHKFRTEMCKNFEFYGWCRFGEECSYAHTKVQIMMKNYVSVNYKTKLCKKFQASGYCPYGQRCLFIHEKKEPQTQTTSNTVKSKPSTCFPKTYADIVKNKENYDSCNGLPPLQHRKKSFKKSELEVPVMNSFSSVLIHSINVSLQEHQKKISVYNKKLGKKTCDKKGLAFPDFEPLAS